MDVAQFFYADYWLSIAPGPITIWTTIFLCSFFVLFIVLKLFLKYLAFHYRKHLHKPQRKLLSLLESLCLTLGTFGLLWLFFAYQMVPYISSRFFFLAWVLALIVWLYIIGFYAFNEMPEKMREIEEREKFEKYLSKKEK